VEELEVSHSGSVGRNPQLRGFFVSPSWCCYCSYRKLQFTCELPIHSAVMSAVVGAKQSHRWVTIIICFACFACLAPCVIFSRGMDFTEQDVVSTRPATLIARIASSARKLQPCSLVKDGIRRAWDGGSAAGLHTQQEDRRMTAIRKVHHPHACTLWPARHAPCLVAPEMVQ